MQHGDSIEVHVLVFVIQGGPKNEPMATESERSRKFQKTV